MDGESDSVDGEYPGMDGVPGRLKLIGPAARPESQAIPSYIIF